MHATAPSPGAIFVIAIIIIIVVVVVGKLVLDGAAALGEKNAQAREQRVKRSSSGPHPVMSRPLTNHTPAWRVAAVVDAPLTAGQSGKSVNDWLTVDADHHADEDDITEERAGGFPRNDIQYAERLATLADLINGGVVGQAEGIEKAFKVTRSGRKDSRYAQIRADLLPLLRKEEAATPIAGRPTAGTFRSDNPAYVEQDS